jgi:hypothetical protein
MMSYLTHETLQNETSSNRDSQAQLFGRVVPFQDLAYDIAVAVPYCNIKQERTSPLQHHSTPAEVSRINTTMVSHTDDMELSDELEEDELSADLKEAIQANDFDRLEAALDVRPSVSQEKLDECLKAAMPEASTDIIRLLLQRGAKLQMWSYGQAITRSEPEVFQLLMDHGWDIDSTEFGRPAVLLVPPPLPLCIR